MKVVSDDPEEFQPRWNTEEEDLVFLNEEGLELLAVFRSIKDKTKRRLLFDLIKLIAGDHNEPR